VNRLTGAATGVWAGGHGASGLTDLATGLQAGNQVVSGLTVAVAGHRGTRW
jgi:hypothetical protein